MFNKSKSTKNNEEKNNNVDKGITVFEYLSSDNIISGEVHDIDDDIFYPEEFKRGRDFSSIDFQNRIIKKSMVDTLPILESTNFLSIAYNNLEELMAVRVPKTKEDVKDFIRASFSKMNDIYMNLLELYPKLFCFIITKERMDIIDNEILEKEFKKYSVEFANFLPSDKGYYLLGKINNKNFKVSMNDFILTLGDRFVFEVDFLEYMISKKYDNVEIYGLIQNINMTTFEVGEKHANYIYNFDEFEEYGSDIDLYTERTAFITSIKSDEEMKFMNVRSLPDPIIVRISNETIALRVTNSFLRKAFKESAEYFFPKDEKMYLYTKYDFEKELEKGPICIANPYYDYKVVLDFIHQMCYSDNIEDIYITIYRAFEDSQIVHDLKYAAKSGKNVFVNFELSARSNEISNWNFGEDLKDAGCMVTSSFFNLKVHAKCFLAVSHDKKHFYSHVSTGNYNETTAKFYTDVNYITKDINIGFYIFNTFVRIFDKQPIVSQSIDHEVVMFAPLDIKNNLIQRIEVEGKKGKNGVIRIKCNNMDDDDIINALYKAADNGCDVIVICRTSCGIKYRKGMKVYSRIWKYLEHDRIYILGTNVFIGSSDLLERNLYNRIEVCAQIFDYLSKKQVINVLYHAYNDFEYGELFELTENNRWELVSK